MSPGDTALTAKGDGTDQGVPAAGGGAGTAGFQDAIARMTAQAPTQTSRKRNARASRSAADRGAIMAAAPI